MYTPPHCKKQQNVQSKENKCRATSNQHKTPALFIIIPAYNESENIRQLVDDWYPIIEKYGNENSRLVIIDDGSKDDTYKILKNLAKTTGKSKNSTNSKADVKTYTKLQPLTKPNGGHGATVLFGYNYALKNGADFIFQTDSDGQTLPSEFDQFWKLRNEYDMVIGHRKGREDGFSRIIVTKTLRRVIRLKFKVWVKDANTPFRLMSAKSLRENIKYVPKDFNLSNVVLSVVYEKQSHQKVKYLPVTFRPRQGGTNSINLKNIFNIGKQALKDFREINKSLKELDREKTPKN